jgi:hypothetical protein
LQLLYGRNYKFDESYFFAFGGNDESFHGGTIKRFSGGSVKAKMPFPDSVIDFARKPRARLKDCPSINGLLAAE